MRSDPSQDDAGNNSRAFKVYIKEAEGFSLTAQFNPNEVLNSQVLQEDAGGRAGLEEEGNIGAQLAVERGEVEVGGFFIEVGRIPEVI